MKIILFILINFYFHINLQAQSETEYRPIIDTFVSNFNSGRVDLVFASFSPELQKSLTLEKTKEFVIGLKSQVGKIMNLKIANLQLLNSNDLRIEYETKCEKVSFIFSFVVEKDKKIGGIHINRF